MLMCSLVHEPTHTYKCLYNHYINTLTHEHAYKMNPIHSLNAYKFTNTHGHTYIHMFTCSIPQTYTHKFAYVNIPTDSFTHIEHTHTCSCSLTDTFFH